MADIPGPHAHQFPCLPPDGDLLAPGDCTVCGKPYALDVAQKRAAEAGMVLLSRSQLVNALTRLDVRVLTSGPAAGMINAESMADAILEALGGRG